MLGGLLFVPGAHDATAPTPMPLCPRYAMPGPSLAYGTQVPFPTTQCPSYAHGTAVAVARGPAIATLTWDACSYRWACCYSDPNVLRMWCGNQRSAVSTRTHHWCWNHGVKFYKFATLTDQCGVGGRGSAMEHSDAALRAAHPGLHLPLLHPPPQGGFSLSLSLSLLCVGCVSSVCRLCLFCACCVSVSSVDCVCSRRETR